MASSVFWEIKNKNKNLPACLICFSKKWPEKHLFIFFSLIYHHHIDVYVLIFSQVHIKVFFTYDTMAERPLGSFDSLTFCGFRGAMPPDPSFTYFLYVAATYFQFPFRLCIDYTFFLGLTI